MIFTMAKPATKYMDGILMVGVGVTLGLLLWTVIRPRVLEALGLTDSSSTEETTSTSTTSTTSA